MKRLSDDPAVRLAECQDKPSCMGDAYVGAREDVAIWKKRALEAEEKVRIYGERVVDLGVLGMQTAVRKPAFDEAAERVKFEDAFPVEQGSPIHVHVGNKLRYEGWLACAKFRTEVK